MRPILFLLNLFIFGTYSCAQADVVKPALVEISAYSHGSVKIELRVSLEALLTGINAQYKNTQDAPNAEAYDAYRVLPPADLGTQFETFKPVLLDHLWLKADGRVVDLHIESIDIPEPGYTKVPRISVVQLSADLDRSATSLQWYYPEKFGDNAVRVRQVDVKNQRWHWSDWQWLRADQPSEAFSLTEVFTRQALSIVIKNYTVLGFEHIVPRGTDHVLFILGIFLLSLHIRPLLWQVTMFTLAHTLTLGLSINGIIDLPARIVEPLIALSIAYIGFENIYHRSLHRSRLLLVFCFGLLHGLGFAGVLSDFGMPADDFVIALISFNIGVELGQLVVIGLAFLLVGLWFRQHSGYRKWVVVPGSAMIALIGLYWTYDRLAF